MQHQTEVKLTAKVRGDAADPYAWMARCSCGWLSRAFATRREAEHDADDHVGIMARSETDRN